MPTQQDNAFNSPTSSHDFSALTELKSQSDARQLTFGEQLVGLNFNPSNDDKVGQAKKLFAAAADLLKSDFESRGQSGLAATLYEHTLGEILNAQMNVVKVLTLKY